MSKLNATIRCEDYVHFRPATIVKRVCDLFPDTSFTVARAESVDVGLRTIDPKGFMSLASACLVDGERVEISTDGPTPQLAAAFLKGILENLGIVYANAQSQSPAPMREAIADLLSGIASEHPDPMRHVVMERVEEDIRERPPAYVGVSSSQSHSAQASINARLHGAIVEVLPRIAAHYGCQMDLRYKHPAAGDLVFDVSSDDDWVKFDILAFSPAIGTQVTVTASGEQPKALCDYMAGLLQHLAEVDAWIRTCFLGKRSDAELVEGIMQIVDKAGVALAPVATAKQVDDYRLNDVLVRELVVLNPEPVARDDVLDELTGLVAHRMAMDSEDLRQLVALWNDQVNVCSDGFAYVHARAAGCPLITLAIGVYPQGVAWPSQEERKHVVALMIAGVDTPNTYMGYMGRLMSIFRRNRPLISALTKADTTSDILMLLKSADTSAQQLREQRRQEKRTRLLIVESFEDDITLGRHDLLSSSPRMQDFRIDYIYAVPQKTQSGADLQQAEFAERLRARMAEFMPHYVLFHTGMVFLQQVSWFQDLVRDLRNRFGSTRFGYQKKKNLVVDRTVFSEDPDTQRIQSLVFNKILGI